MKKFLGILLALVGLLLTAAGIAGVILIGSDDTIDSPTTTITLGDAKALVSTPALLAFKDTTMRLTAESTGGSVFLGQAHPIDAKSYLSAAPTFAVTKVGTSGMSGEVVKGDAKTTLPDPTKQTFWTAKATGAGKQTLALELDGTPTEYVVMPIGKPGDVTVTSGIQIDNGFTLSIGAIVLGVLAFIAGLLLWRRRRAQLVNRQAANTTDETVGANDVPAPARTMSRIVGIGVIAAAVPTLAGCGMVPIKVDTWKGDTLTKPAMANRAEAVAAMKDYDVRNNAAITAIAKTFKPAVWEGVDSGVVLAGDRLDTRYAALTKKWEVQPVTTTVKDVYASQWGSYPMYAFVSASTQVKGDEPQDVLVTMRRASAASSWVMDSKAWHDAPLPKPARSASPLGAADQKTAMKVANAAMTSLNGGKGGPALPKQVTEYLAQERKLETGLATATAKADFFNTTRPDQMLPDGSVRAVRLDEGLLVQASYSVQSEQTTKPNWTTSLKDKKYAAVSYQEGDRTSIRSTMAVTLTMIVDPKGATKVVGRGFQFVI
ncbi:hypothetical protein ACOCJ7_18040 [Knoellia sp. CPCC 206453]|uniref:hypothetical protein n=1 Tax=Knoellia pratensis TaxID=3404796 RepID=UPI0036158E5E